MDDLENKDNSTTAEPAKPIGYRMVDDGEGSEVVPVYAETPQPKQEAPALPVDSQEPAKETAVSEDKGELLDTWLANYLKEHRPQDEANAQREGKPEDTASASQDDEFKALVAAEVAKELAAHKKELEKLYEPLKSEAQRAKAAREEVLERELKEEWKAEGIDFDTTAPLVRQFFGSLPAKTQEGILAHGNEKTQFKAVLALMEIQSGKSAKDLNKIKQAARAEGEKRARDIANLNIGSGKPAAKDQSIDGTTAAGRLAFYNRISGNDPNELI